MKTTLNNQVEALKEKITDVSEKSKKNIDSVIDSNSKQLASAVDSNKVSFEALNKMLYENKIDTSAIAMMKTLLAKDVKLTEEFAASIIDSFTRLVNLNIDFASKFMDIVNTQNMQTKGGREMISDLYRENLRTTADYSAKDLEKMVSIFTSQLHNDMELNKTLAENIRAQMMQISGAQNRNFENFFTWGKMLNPWWKSDGSGLKKS